MIFIGHIQLHFPYILFRENELECRQGIKYTHCDRIPVNGCQAENWVWFGNQATFDLFLTPGPPFLTSHSSCVCKASDLRPYIYMAALTSFHPSNDIRDK